MVARGSGPHQSGAGRSIARCHVSSSVVLRVAYDVTPLFGRGPAAALTGVGVFTAEALGALSRRSDVHVEGYATTWRGRSRLLPRLPQCVGIARLPMPERPLYWSWSRFDGPAVEWWTGQVDAVHGTNYVVPPGHRAAEVVTVHDLTVLRFPELCEPGPLKFPALIRRALRRGAMVHVHSHAIGVEVVELLGAREERVRVVPPGIEFDRGAARPTRDNGKRPYVLAMGTVEPRKGFPDLVKAFDSVAASIPDVELIIAGQPGWGQEALEKAITESQHARRIRTVGWVDRTQRDILLRDATLFAFPSIYEGFGFPPLEAMAAGVPVVASAAGSIPEAVGDAARLVPPGDTDALAAALVDLLDHADKRSDLVGAGWRRVATFTWDRCAKGLADLYRDAVALHRGPP